MRSVDANVVLRWLTRDDPVQVLVADRIMATPVFVPLTVLVEVHWVLQRTFRFDRATLNGALRVLLDLETVSVASEQGIRWCLDRHSAGADLPDMMHLVASAGAASFATFEKDLSERAGPDTPVPVEYLG